MTARGELLALSCIRDDLLVLEKACGPRGPIIRILDNAVEVAQYLVSRRPLAVFLCLGKTTRDYLDLIPVIRAVKGPIPVIVIAEEDSLELERNARQKNIFYYLVHPIEFAEVQAVLKDILRHWKG